MCSIASEGNYLAGLAARLSQGLLDMTHLRHVIEGTIVVTPQRRFFVDDACSGTNSRLTISCIALVMCALRRRSGLHALILLAVSAMMSVATNVLRICVVIGGAHFYGLELESGMPHQMLGVAFFMLDLMLVWSADHGTGFLLHRGSMPRRISSRQDTVVASPRGLLPAGLSVSVALMGGVLLAGPSLLVTRHASGPGSTLDASVQHFEMPEVSEILLSMAQHSAGSIAEWPIKLPCNDDVLLVGGWPRSLVEHGQVHGELSFGFLWFAGRINGVSERTISLELQIAESTAISCDYVEPGVDLGGWSGGAVLRCIDSGLIEHIELCGIIYQSDEGSNVVLAHPLASLNSDGTFS